MERFLFMKRPRPLQSCDSDTSSTVSEAAIPTSPSSQTDTSSLENEVQMASKKLTTETSVEPYTRPNQPEVIPMNISPQSLQNKTLKFRTAWYKDYMWLHINSSGDGVLCFYCNKYATDNKTKSLKKKLGSMFL